MAMRKRIAIITRRNMQSEFSLYNVDIEVAALVVIADLTNEEARAKGLGTAMIEEKYGTKVYSIITAKDMEGVLEQ